MLKTSPAASLFLKTIKYLNGTLGVLFGEIDIVALDRDTLVFVEVKARWSHKYGAPEEAVTKSKISKIIKTGQYYSLLHPESPKRLRIDVVALDLNGNNVTSSKIISVF